MIKRIFLIVFLHVLVIFFLLTTHPQAKEDGWTIEDHGTYIVTSVPGEVIHDDKLRFVLDREDCSKVRMMFSFLSYKENSSIYELEGKKIPIIINDFPTDELVRADILFVLPLPKTMAQLVVFSSLGSYNINSFSKGLMDMYFASNLFEIKLARDNKFNPSKYFDILENNWRLDEYPQKITLAKKMCSNVMVDPDKVLFGKL